MQRWIASGEASRRAVACIPLFHDLEEVAFPLPGGHRESMGLNSGLAALIAIAAVLFAVPALRERALPGRGWMLLRALFPSWRFFEELGHVPKLSYRLLPAEAWIDCLPREPRRLGSLFLNPRGNLRMACNSLVEQVVTDLGELPDDRPAAEFEGSVSYRLVTQLVRYRIREAGAAAPGASFQFRIVAAVPGSTENEAQGFEEALVSSVHEV